MRSHAERGNEVFAQVFAEKLQHPLAIRVAGDVQRLIVPCPFDHPEFLGLPGALKQLAGTTSSSAMTSSSLGRTAWFRWVAAALLFAGITLVVTYLASPRMNGAASAAPTGNAAITAPSFRQLTFRRGQIGKARFTPDGQTVIIGGLMQNAKAISESKIPFIGDIPLLGNLFKHKITTEGRTELIIFLTPYIIHTPTEIAALSQREREKSDATKALTERELEKFLDKLPATNQPPKSVSPKKHK